MSALLEEALAPHRLFAAWSKVRSNKGCAGTDRVSIARFERVLEGELGRLSEEVRAGRYRPRPLLCVEMTPSGKKPRRLAIPTVRDRVLQTAVAQTLTPLFEAEFEACSFAYRRGRSVDMALAEVRRWRDQGYRWVVDADIQAFFDELDHALLMEAVAALVPDERLVKLIRDWVRAELWDGDVRWCLVRGVPQGAPIAPHLANLYLDQFDEALLARNLRLVRYSDDFLILCRDRERAEDVLEITEDVLGGLNLALNNAITRVVDFKRGFRFLGAQFVRSLMYKCKAAGVQSPGFSAMPATCQGSEGRVKGGAMAPQTPTRRPISLRTGNVMSEAFAALARREGYDGISAWAGSLGKAQDPEATVAGQMDEEAEGGALSFDPLLRTLYVLRHGCVLGRDGERLVVRGDGEVLREIPALMVDQIIIFGNVQVTTQALHFCLTRGIPIMLLSSGGAFRGMVDALDHAPVILQRAQFRRAADKDFCLETARAMVTGKIANARLVLRRRARKRSLPAFVDAERAMAGVQRNLERAASLEELRGFEGVAARFYFQAFAVELGKAWGFNGRHRRPPPDPVNALLSFGYMLLYHNIFALVRACGLHPHVGFLHPLRSGHPALVSDLMEEFRSLVVDATVLSLLFNGKVESRDFDSGQNGGVGCHISERARRLFVQAFERKMNSSVCHPEAGRRGDYRRCIAWQVRRLADAVQDDGARPYRAMVLR